MSDQPRDIYDFAYPSRSAVLNAHKRHRSTMNLGGADKDTVTQMKKYGRGGYFPAKAFAPDRVEWQKSSMQDR